ncbi:allophanate hydrolase [Nevskia sp.]|uniref:allophanate hydrolase n=1 Tax=Nevskia sp. TaxID=1929292 RepID=UPI0025FA19A9|nr:allophanate hydrolase [Nevskia sp.]
MAPDAASELDSPKPLALTALHAAMRGGELMPGRLLRRLLALRDRLDRPEIWISQPADTALIAEAERLDALLALEGPAILDRLPLFGLPFAVKDNIDVAGQPTTAACPAFAYTPERSATAVTRLIAAGALYLGKTNLDQFATGLVGTRSPYGAVRNAVDPAYVSGGSSSGSAVAVALGLAVFALGTDTAGSGRVPAGFNGIVGLKPSIGLVSTQGLVPACKSLDCLSVFAGSVADAWTVLSVISGVDHDDARSRRLPMLPPLPRGARIGLAGQTEFFGDRMSETAYGGTIGALRGDSAMSFTAIDLAPLLAAAELLYAGPWIAERRIAIGAMLDERPSAIDPTVRAVIAETESFSAEDLFRAEYRLTGYRAHAARLFEQIDVLLLPTAPTHPRISAVQAEPIARNRELGHYTNFVNLLDLAAIAIPGLPRDDGLPFGITLIGPAGSDHRLAVLAARLQQTLADTTAAATLQLAAEPLPFTEATIAVAVVGAHLAGQPLNWQLLECGARCTALTQTAPRYRLYALANTTPAKPGLVRVAEGGEAIEVEVWEMPQRQFGKLMSQVGAPLGIGTLELEDGTSVKGFICEPIAVVGAVDITHHGGWRRYLAANFRASV